jgi:ssDNA-specific exonuclease RecJ
MEGFTFASALELNMGYYHIKLDADAQKLYSCIPIQHRQKRIKTITHLCQDCLIPDVFSNFMSKVFQGMEYVIINMLS